MGFVLPGDRQAINVTKVALPKVTPASSPNYNKSFHIQAEVYKSIKFAKLGSSFHKVVERRIRSLSLKVSFPNLEYLVSNLEEGLAECSELHKICGSALMSNWIKTIANGWCTSGRMHEDVRLPCIFGCESATDEFAHYLTCGILWNMLRKHFYNYISHIPQTRLALPFPTPPDILIVASAFHTYHSLKIGSRSIVDEAIHSNNFSVVARLAAETLSDYVATHGSLIFRKFMAPWSCDEPLYNHLSPTSQSGGDGSPVVALALA